MSVNDAYQPINCDDYDSLELACQQRLALALELVNGETIAAKVWNLVSRKNIEYLVVADGDDDREIRLDKIISFSHPKLGTITVSHS